MIPNFNIPNQPTLVVSIFILIVGVANLIVASRGFYLTHIRSPKSDIELRPREDGHGTVKNKGSRVEYSLHFNAINQGNADGWIIDGRLNRIKFIRNSDGNEHAVDDLPGSRVMFDGPTSNDRIVPKKTTDRLVIKPEVGTTAIDIFKLTSEYDTAIFHFNIKIGDQSRQYRISTTNNPKNLDISGVTLRQK